MRVFILLLFIFSAVCRAEEPEKPTIQEIFEKIEGNLTVQAILEFPFYSFYLGAPNIKGVAYLPSFAPRFGPQLTWHEYSVKFTFALPIPEVEQHRRGSSDQSGAIFNSYWRQNAMDLYYQRFRGFYVSSPFRELSVHKPERYPQLPDALVTNYGLNWYYVTNPERFSLKAAFDHNEFQRVSGGSWLANPFYNHFDMALGSRFIAGIGDESIQDVPNLASGRFDSIGSSFGYGYSFIYGRFFASAQGALGPGLQLQQFRGSDGNDVRDYSLAVKINVNASTGWNYKEYVGGIKFLLDSLSSRVQGTEVASNLVSGQIFFGSRV
jgi:hypothetical protein